MSDTVLLWNLIFRFLGPSLNSDPPPKMNQVTLLLMQLLMLNITEPQPFATF